MRYIDSDAVISSVKRRRKARRDGTGRDRTGKQRAKETGG